MINSLKYIKTLLQTYSSSGVVGVLQVLPLLPVWWDTVFEIRSAGTETLRENSALLALLTGATRVLRCFSERNTSSKRSAADALLLTSTSKHRKMKFFAIADSSSGISGCFL